MTRNISLANAVARASVQRQLVAVQLATKHLSLASFAHELELVQESFEFGLATQREVTGAQDRLVTAWRDHIDCLSLDFDREARATTQNERRH